MRCAKQAGSRFLKYLIGLYLNQLDVSSFEFGANGI